MARSVFVEPDKKNASTMQLVGELSARMRAVQRMLPYFASAHTLDHVREKVPQGAKDLKKALRISRIKGLPDNQTGYVIHAVPRGKATKRSEEESTVLYVSPKSNLLRPVPKSVRILEEHSPWTVDTLPFQPEVRTSVVVSRSVNPRVVAKVREDRQRDRPIWRRKMVEAGLRETRKDKRIRRNRALKAIPDVAYDSLRLEFGLGGMPSKPHWRPAILKLASGGLAGMIRSNREISRTMTDPNYQTWRSWKPSELKGTVSILQAMRYVPFQHVLGIRLGGMK